MKKLITIILIIALILPATVLTEDAYTPHLNMTMQEYLLKYNAIQAAIGSPYVLLDQPYAWTDWNGYKIAWFYSDKDSKTTILLMTKDPSCNYDLTGGLDMIQIFNDDNDFVSLLSVITRCSKVFAAEVFGTSMAPMRVADVISYYYENNCKERGLSYYAGLDEDGKTILTIFYDQKYFFQISSIEDMQ